MINDDLRWSGHALKTYGLQPCIKESDNIDKDIIVHRI